MKLKDADLVNSLGQLERKKVEALAEKTLEGIVADPSAPALVSRVADALEAAYHLGWSVGRRTTTTDDWID